jgi:hypothetical protein
MGEVTYLHWTTVEMIVDGKLVYEGHEVLARIEWKSALAALQQSCPVYI